MQKLSFTVGLSIMLLVGCVHQKAPEHPVTPATIAASSQSQPQAQPRLSDPRNPLEESNEARLLRCRKELDAMQMYNRTTYDKYQAEFHKLTAKTSKYMQVQNAIGPEINDIMMPRTQSQFRELCFRVKSALAQLIIDQA